MALFGRRTTRAVEALLQGQTEALTQQAIQMALDGDTTALRLFAGNRYFNLNAST